MICEILSIGTELLLGDILNTNAQFLSRELAKLGFNQYFQTVVGDNEGRLLSALDIAFGRAELVIATGGLGPTQDDISKEISAKYFGLELEMDNESLERIKGFFAGRNQEMPKSNEKQALIPRGSVILPNDNGTAPGCIIEKNGKSIILLPGPPWETEPMFIHYVLPYLHRKSDSVLVSRTLKIIGIGESKAAEMVKDLIDSQTNPTIAPYAKLSEASLRITARAKNTVEAMSLVEPIASEIYNRFGNHIYGENETTLAEALVNILNNNKLTIACAESCTGGMLSSRLVDCPGVSEVLRESCITYSNEAKMARLGVKRETLEQFGAVSEETAREMVEGIISTANSDCGISITGIAGPGGGTADKPVGLVYIGAAVKNGDGFTCEIKRLNLRGGRQEIRERTVIMALDLLRRMLNNIYKI